MQSQAIKTVACAMSGGIDSCVAAILLKKKGYQVKGVFMRNWDLVDEKGYCQANKDKEDADYICKKIGIPLHEVNFVEKYWNSVFSYLINEYKAGKTPNPDILCNKNIKFDAFLKYSLNTLKVDAIATGHYARIESFSDCAGKGFRLLKGVDENKDQTFFLAQIPRSALEKTIFPLGKMTKQEVKEIARSEGFHRIVKKKESVGICFIGRREFQTFIEDYIEPSCGNFVDVENNKIVGQHRGIHCWTVGQRCMLPGLTSAYYVVDKDVSTQDILVAPGQMHPALFYESVVTEPAHWISPCPLDSAPLFHCHFRFQHRERPVRCLISLDGKGLLQVLLRHPLRAVTPGQFAVFYDGDECLGSAKILTRGPSMYALRKAYNKRVS